VSDIRDGAGGRRARAGSGDGDRDAHAELDQDGAGPVDVVDGERLERLQAQSFDDILRDLPGVTTLGGPRGAAELPQIRGLGSDRIIIRQDGTRQNFQSGHKGRVLVNPVLIKRVEVVKGPSSALFRRRADHDPARL
jgi:hemoglobin/transferrin/lactoferrin receptor protein